MKTIFLLLSLLCTLGAQAQNITTATVTITNTAGTTNGQTITVNGVVRTWTNSVTAVSTQILTNDTISGSASNLFLAFATTRAPNADLAVSSTNGIFLKSFPGSPMVVSLSAGWGTVSLSTNPITPSTPIIWPAATGNYVKTNATIAIVDYLNGTGTNTVSAASPAMVNFVNTSTDQTVGGVKTFTGANVLSNSAQAFDGGTISNVNVSANNITGTNLTLQTGAYSGGYVFPVAYFNFRNPDQSLATFNITVNPVGFVFNGAIQCVNLSVVDLSVSGTANTMPSQAITGDSSILNYGLANTFYTLQTNGVAFGLSATNTQLTGTNTVDGQVSYLRKNLTGLANGANSINASTNTYLKVSGPSGAFSINGIAGGTDGRMLIIQNSTGYTLTIAHDSGTEPTAANRIYCGTGADIVSARNPGCFTLIYDSAVTRWILVNNN